MTEINLFNINLFGNTDSGGSGSGSGGGSTDGGKYVAKISNITDFGIKGNDYYLTLDNTTTHLYEYVDDNTIKPRDFSPNWFNNISRIEFLVNIENQGIANFTNFNNPVTFKFKEIDKIWARQFTTGNSSPMHTLDFSITKTKPILFDVNGRETTDVSHVLSSGVDKIICPKSWGWHEWDTETAINFEFTDGTKRPATYPSIKFKIFAARKDDDVKIISSGNDGEIKNAYIVNDEKAWLYPENGDKNNWMLHCEFGQEYDVVIEFTKKNMYYSPLKMIGQSGWWDIDNIRWFNNNLRNPNSDIHLVSNTIEYIGFKNPYYDFFQCYGGWDDLGDENYAVLNTGGLTLDLTQSIFTNDIDTCLLKTVGYGNSDNTIIKVKNDDKVSQWQTAVEYAQAGTCDGKHAMVMLETE